jgi:hypothetical protein
MKSNATSESRPRAPAFRFQGDGVASINMLSIGALSVFFDTSGPVDGRVRFWGPKRTFSRGPSRSLMSGKGVPTVTGGRAPTRRPVTNMSPMPMAILRSHLALTDCTRTRIGACGPHWRQN